jgi:GNAT superfamily N-acetyltransferase
VIGGDEARRLRANLATMRLLVPTAHASGIALVVRAGGRLAGAMLATPPGGYPLPPPPVGARFGALLRQGLRVAHRWRVVFETLDAAHPREPHWYLGVLGVDPDRQGRGVGRALLARFTAFADAGREPAYLETDRPENVRFYARAGFRVAGELDVLGARVWRMERPPRV